MPDFKTLGIMEGISQGVNQGTKNLFTIMQKKRELKQKEELFGLQKKKSELELKELELTGTDPETVQLNKDRLKFQTEKEKVELENEKYELEQKRKGITGQLKDMVSQAKAIDVFKRSQQDALQLPGAGGVATEEQGGFNLPQGWDISGELTLGEDPKITAKTREAPEVDAGEEKKLASGLRKEFNQDKNYKDFQTIQRSERAMGQALQLALDPKEESRIASDQALGVLFQKMLDPDSVVRESEYARTPEGASLFNRITAFIPRLQKGGLALEDADRRALYDVAKKLLTESKKTFNQHIDRYTEIADLYEVNPKMIFGNIDKFEIEGEQAPQEEEQVSPELQKIKDKYGLE